MSGAYQHIILALFLSTVQQIAKYSNILKKKIKEHLKNNYFTSLQVQKFTKMVFFHYN
jgi:hypothetical protein